MKDSEDAPKTTSRRRFTKTAASALVAMPVISSLSSCAQRQPPLPPPPGTPSPQPSPSGSPRIGVERGSNPPIIIDGGSLSILTVPRFEKSDDETDVFKFKHIPDDENYRKIKGVIIISDDAQPLVNYALANDTEVLEVSIWIETVRKKFLQDEYDYDGVDVSVRADMIITAGKTSANQLTIRTDEEIKNPKRSPKRKNDPKYRRYLKGDWDSKGNKQFRIAAVGAKVGPTVLLPPAESDYGFKIVFVVP